MKDLDSRTPEPATSTTTRQPDMPPALRELSVAEVQQVSGGTWSITQ
jgi:hypothetical protein